MRDKVWSASVAVGAGGHQGQGKEEFARPKAQGAGFPIDGDDPAWLQDGLIQQAALLVAGDDTVGAR